MDLEELKAQHRGFLHVDRKSSPGQVRDSHDILELVYEVERLRAALHELCELKIIKDVLGDVPWYRERKAKAWPAAFACFPEYASCAATDEGEKRGS